MAKKKSLGEVIKSFKLKHGNKYDYSLVDYKNNNTEVIIICPNHGKFKQIPRSHLTSGCSKCAFDSYKRDFNDLQKVIIDTHGYNLIINKFDYKNMYTKIKVKCREHGIFHSTPTTLIRGHGCIHCSDRKRKTLYFLKFKKLAREIHGDKYDYSLVNYTYRHEKVNIICPIHGVWEQTPHGHLSGRGCEVCKESIGERDIRKLLEHNNIKYEPQKVFEGCKFKRNLKFDFYLPQYRICIEYNGRQHYESVDLFGGKLGFESTKKRDNIKKEYCLNNNIPLIEIKYDEDIEEKLNHLFG